MRLSSAVSPHLSERLVIIVTHEDVTRLNITPHTQLIIYLRPGQQRFSRFIIRSVVSQTVVVGSSAEAGTVIGQSSQSWTSLRSFWWWSGHHQSLLMMVPDGAIPVHGWIISIPALYSPIASTASIEQNSLAVSGVECPHDGGVSRRLLGERQQLQRVSSLNLNWSKRNINAGTDETRIVRQQLHDLWCWGSLGWCWTPAGAKQWSPAIKILSFIEMSHLQFEKITFMRLFKLLSRNLRL